MNEKNSIAEIQAQLFKMQDIKYKQFQGKLLPTLSGESITGVRAPALKKYALELAKKGLDNVFLSSLPHRYYEENMLHSFIICNTSDFDECISKTEQFLPFVDNWAVCDSLRPRCFKSNKERLLPFAEKYLSSHHSYTVRFGIEMLTVHFLDESFDPVFLEKVSKIQNEDYYVQMMISWFFATALTKQYDSAVVYIEERKLPSFIHRKSIQKACESLCIPEEKKQYLKIFRTNK